MLRNTLPNALKRKEVQSLDGVRLKAAHARLANPSPSTVVQPDLIDRLSRTVESALLDAHGSQKAAAIEIQVDPSQLKRQLRLGTFDLRQQAAAGDVFLATLGHALVEEFGSAQKSQQEQALEQLGPMVALIIRALLGGSK